MFVGLSIDYWQSPCTARICLPLGLYHEIVKQSRDQAKITRLWAKSPICFMDTWIFTAVLQIEGCTNLALGSHFWLKAWKSWREYWLLVWKQIWICILIICLGYIVFTRGSSGAALWKVCCHRERQGGEVNHCPQGYRGEFFQYYTINDETETVKPDFTHWPLGDVAVILIQ